MAITYKGGVGGFDPVYNPMWFYFDSNNKSKPGFRYIFDLYPAGGVSFTRFNPPPRPGDGWGQENIAPFLQCLIGYDNSVTSVFPIAAKNSYYSYDIKIGEEYLAEFAYTGYSQYTGSGTPYDGRVRLDGIATNTLVVGDQIEVLQTDGGLAVPLLQSLFTVVAKPSASTAVINLPYYMIAGMAAMGGTITYSDKRKIQVPNLYTQSGLTAYNGALDVIEFNGYDFALRQMSAATGNKKFLTSAPNPYTIALDSDMHFNIANMGTTVPFYLYVTTSDGGIFRKAISPDITSKMMQVPVGTANMVGFTVLAGSLPIIKDTTTSYEVRVKTSGAVDVSEAFTFNLDRRCDTKGIRLVFMDRQGSLASMSFALQAMYENDYQKETYEADNGGFDAGQLKFQYNPQKGGKTTIAVDRTEGMKLTTNWVPWEIADYYGELLGSPVVLLKESGIYRMVDVKTVTQPNQHPNKKKLQNRVIEVSGSNLNPINA